MNFPALAMSGGVAVLRRSARLQMFVVSLLMPGLALTTSPVVANPQGGHIIHGDVSIGAGTGGNLQILQNSPNAIINWESFSINAGELTRFNQPNSSAAVLNRVTGGDPSAIHGALQANGNVFVINPNGILVGPSGSIDVHGLVLSTLDVSDGEFLAGGDMTFKGVGENVTNLGRINGIGGDVFLIGRTVTNSGSIRAGSGTVGLAAGEEVLLTAKGNTGERLFVRAKGSGVSGTGILNDGTIEGAAVELKAHGNMYALAINNKGTVRATGAVNAGGKVYLRGVGGSVSQSGSIRATSSGAGNAGRVLIESIYAKVDGMIRAEGGEVRVTGAEGVDLSGGIDVSSLADRGGDVVLEGREIELGNGAAVDASGATGGGSVRIGGGFQGNDDGIVNAERLTVGDGALLRADAGVEGDGGTVILWSDGDTRFQGKVSAEALGEVGDGGFVEVSGKGTLLFDGVVSTLAVNGRSGTLLLDPEDFVIGTTTGVNTLSATDLVAALGSNSVIVSTGNGNPAGETGTISVNSAVNWNNANQLSLLAHGDIRFNASVRNSGSGHLVVIAGWDGSNGHTAGSPGGNAGGVLDFANFVANPGWYGNANGTATGSVYVGDGLQAAGISVGSLLGKTQVAAFDVELKGSNGGFAQIGYGGTGDGGGDIAVHAGGTVSLTGGTRYDNAHAQIGHGGYQLSGNKGGNISVLAGNGVTLTADQTGTGRFATAQIGHGGRGAPGVGGNFSGSITVDGGAGSVDLVAGQVVGAQDFRAAQIGHGGSYDAAGDFDGHIRVTGANVNLDAGAHTYSYARIGHGGWTGGVNTGNRTGDIYVGTPGEISLEDPAGGGVAAIGHHNEPGAGTIHDVNMTLSAASMDTVFGGSGSDVFEFSGTLASTMVANLALGDVSLHAVGAGGMLVTHAANLVFTASNDLNLLSAYDVDIRRAIQNAGTGNLNVVAGWDPTTAPLADALSGTISGIDMENEIFDVPGAFGNNQGSVILSNAAGAAAIGSLFGETNVAGYDVTLTGTSAGLAQIGFFGTGDGHGDIRVGAVNQVGLTGGDKYDNAHAQIGHGGYQIAGNKGGNITVEAGNGVTLTGDQVGTGRFAAAHIGHGGRGATTQGNQYTGNITVDGGAGSVDLVAGQLVPNTSWAFRHAQIGHGWSHDAWGDFSGDIRVTGADINLDGGAAATNYARIGHGGWTSGNNTGDRSGDIHVGTPGEISLDASSGVAAIGHHKNAGAGTIHDANVTLVAASADNVFGASGGNQFAIDSGFANTLAANLVGGDVSLHATGAGGMLVTHTANLVFTASNDLNLLSDYDLGIQGIVRNLGGGNVTAVAGWDKTAAPLADPLTGIIANVDVAGDLIGVANAYGNHDGAVTVGLSTAAAAIGSVAGTTTVLGHAVNVLGGDTTAGAYAMIGSAGVSASGAVTVLANGSVTLEGGDSDNSHAQIGHGGSNMTAASGISGAVTVHSGTGGIRLEGGGGTSSFAQIGNGGYNVEGIISGETVVKALGTAPSDGIRLRGGDGQYAGATIGLGNYFVEQAGSSASGAVTVEVANGGLTMEASTDGRFSYAQIGHSGRDSSGGRSGDVAVTVAGGDITLTAGGVHAESRYNHVQIGHGGYGNGVVADFSGKVTVQALDGAISVDSGDNYGAYAQIGHGGFGAGASAIVGDLSGNIEVEAKGDIAFTAGTADHAYAMLGHGGVNIDGNIKGGAGETIMVTSDEGSIHFAADLTANAISAFTQLGHGGYSSTGNTDAAIIVTALNGGVAFQGGGTGSANGAYAQLGHGGYLAPGDHHGDISVTATGPDGISFTAGNGYFASARIGHGGREAAGNHSGEITIDAGTAALEFDGGVGQNYTSVQIGHGGPYRAIGSHSGAISVDAGSIRMKAGSGADQIFAQIGHGGYDADGNHSGKIAVRALTGDLSLIAGSGSNNYAQIGHGGSYNGGDMSDDICVIVAGSVLLDSAAATGLNAYTQIGNGGYDADGAHEGDITVVAGYGGGAGGVTLLGGGSSSAYAQIGHGGILVNGDLGGDVHVIAENGDIALTGGSGANAYAMFGHGDGSKTSTGTREGGMHIFASGNLTGTDPGGTGAAGEGNVYIFHQNNNGLLPADYIGGGGYEKVANGSISLPGYTTAHESTMIDGNLGIGLIRIVDSGINDYTINGPDLAIDTFADFHIITGGNITMLSSFQNAGTGNVTLVAGWNGEDVTADPVAGVIYEDDGMGGFNYCKPVIAHKTSINIDFNDCESFGNNGKTLTIGSATQTSRVSIGSAGGMNIFAAAGIRLLSSDGTANAATQLGYYGDGTAATGAIDIRVKDLGLSLESGDAEGAFTQIGHGGAGSDASGGVSAAIEISFCDPGDVALLAGDVGDGAYAQIGHGGMGLSGTFSGAVTIDGARDITLAGGGRHAYAQIGHGGSTGVNGTYSAGNPSFTQRALSADGTVQVIHTTGAVSLTGGAGFENAYAQIGHGGVGIAAGGIIEGDVTVEAETGGISLQGGLGSSAHALIGNGGYLILNTLDGAVRVDAKGSGTGDGIFMRGGDGNHTYGAPRSGFSGAMIGNSSYNSPAVSGSTHVSVQNGGLTMEAGDGYYSNATIGHVGLGGGGALNGLVDVDVVGGDIVLEGGSTQWFAFTQIGHGGWDSRNHGGSIDVMARQGDITIRSGNASTFNHAKIGHGGYGNGAVQTNTGTITVEATAGAVVLDSRNGTYAYTQIGHGGLGAGGFMRGEFHDAIAVTAGTGVTLGGGGGSGSFAMIGHGGASVRGIFTGKVEVNAGAEGLVLTGGSRGFTQVGHGGYNDAGAVGVYTISAAPVTVNAGLVKLTGGGTNVHAQIGHGGTLVNGSSGGATAAESAISVTTTGTTATDGVTLKGGTGSYSYAMIGSGGRGGSFDMLGDITVTSAGGGISLEGTVSSAFAQIGNGGHTVAGDFSGTTTVTSNGGGSDDGIALKAGSSSYSYANIGHATNNVTGSMLNSDTIVKILGGGLTLESGSATLAVAAIGLQSRAFYGNRSGKVDITVEGGDVSMTGGTGEAAFVQIGHGGWGINGVGDMSGQVALTIDNGTLTMSGGDASATGNYGKFAMIGHGGGGGYSGLMGGSVIVDVQGAIAMEGGAGGDGATLIGHGGRTRSGTIGVAGDVVNVISRTAGLSMTNGNGSNSFAMIGMGGSSVSGDKTGNVTVSTASGVTMDGTLGGGAQAFVQIGHGGYDSDGTDFNGIVSVTSTGGGLDMSNGDGTAAYAMIGHGGYSTTGNKTGNVTVSTVDGVTMDGTGGDGLYAFLQIGHGGYSSSGTDLNGVVSVTTSEGDLEMSNGDGDDAYTMIGHGGRSTTGNKTGNVTVSTVDGVTMDGTLGGGAQAFVQIGHGGYSSSGTDFNGIVSVTSSGGGLAMSNGNGNNAYAMIGHGGRSTTGNKTGNVTVSTVDGVTMDGTLGDGLYAFLQIGHGGYSSGGSNFIGDISVTGSAATSAVTLLGGDGDDTVAAYQYAMIGHGGGASAASGGKSGIITVEAGSGGIALKGGGTSTFAATTPNSFAQIGHGGAASSGAASGAIEVSTSNGGDILLHGGGRQYSHAQIGHGGRSSVSGLQSGTINVVSDGKVEVKGAVYSDTGVPSSNSTETFAQIGHGGMFSSATFGGAIMVNAQTGVLLESGASHYSRAQVGHGGYGAGTNAGAAVEMVDADVTVTTVDGGVILDASQTTALFAAAMIGNGGTGLYNGVRSGAFRGNITVDGGTGNVELHSGSRSGSHAMIGNGGTSLSGDHSGNIHVSAEGDLIMDLRTSAYDNTFSRIGHGGVGSGSSGDDFVMSGNMSGDICVHVGGAALLDATGGTKTNNYVQIGHGGGRVTGDFTGDITVVAQGSGGLELIAGSGTGAYAQIGHGGTNTAGTMDGNVYVVAENGDISLAGGGTDSYAMLGHGDGAKTSTGQRGGGMHIFAEGDLTGTGGTGAANEGNVYLFHQNNNGLQSGDYLAGSGDGYQKVVNGAISLPGYVTADEGTMISGNLGQGLVQIVDSSATDYVINSLFTEFDTSADFYLLTGGNITMLSSYQNSGTGSVTLVAGWNGVGGIAGPGSVTYASDGAGGFNYCQPVISQGTLSGIDFNDCETFGNGGKTLTIGSAGQTSGVVVGSRYGANTFAAHGIELIAGNGDGAFTQLGYRPTATASGADSGIVLRLKEGGLQMTAGTGVNDAYVQIGHGGTAGENSILNGAIEISFCAPGDVILDAGAGAAGRGSYAQIGHGGNAWSMAKTGAVTIDGAKDVVLNAGREDAYAQIGHGGAKNAAASYGLGAANGAVSVINTTGKIGLHGGSGLNATAQIGHGGVAMRGAMDDAVMVDAGTGGIELSGGSATRTYAMIGNGGYNIDREIDGDVTVNAKGTAATDGIVMNGGGGSYSGAFIGNGIYLNNATVDGNTKVTVANGGLTMAGGGGEASSVGIGHANRSDSNSQTGDVEVGIAEGGFSLTGGLGKHAYAQIGHGGIGGTRHATGNIHVTVDKGDISLKASVGTSSENFSFAQIGHGGWESGDKVGSVTVDAKDGNILVEAGMGDTGTGTYNFARIGHGGYGNNSTLNVVDQAVTVTASGDVTVRGGLSYASFAHIGHGGLGRNSYMLGGVSGAVEVKAIGGAVVVAGGSRSYTHAQIGHGGSGVKASQSGSVLVESGTGGIQLNGGDGLQSYAMIGNGGHDNDQEIGGDVTVHAKGTASTDGIVMSGGGGTYAGAFIGNGIYLNNAAVSGFTDVSVVNGGIAMDGGSGQYAKVGIGHSNNAESNTMTGYVEVDITEGDLTMDGGDGQYASATIGHERNGGTATMTGHVDVDVRKGGISVTGGLGQYSYAVIGHAGRGGTSTSSGDVTVVAGDGDISVTGGNSTVGTSFAAARIGHGIWESGDKTGVITVTAEKGDILVQGGEGGSPGSYNYAQIGHGGYGNNQTQNIVDQAIHVTATLGSVSLKGGTRSANFAQIGHGGLGRGSLFHGSFGGDVTVKAGEAIVLTGGGNDNTHALIGNGGAGLRGPVSGNVLVEAGTGGIALTGGTGTYSFAAIGNGGNDIDDDVSGTTTVRALGTNAATDGIRLHGGNGEQTVAHIGHLHSYGTGASSGSVEVTAEAGDIALEAGDTGYFAHAQIGHGGRDSDGDKSGTVTVTAGNGDVILRAGGNRGSSHYAHAQIGHGGYANGVGSRTYGDDIRVESVTGSVSMAGGNANYDYAQIGHGGTYASTGMSVTFMGKVDVLAAEDIALEGGVADTTYALIGHGGRRIDGSALTAVGGTVDASAITVEAGRDVLLSGGIRSNSGAKIGHGHSSQPLSSFVENKITVDAGRHIELVSAQFGSYTGMSSSGTQIGHGGTSAVVDGGDSGYSGDIIVTAGGKLDLIAAKNATTFNYAFIGHTAYYNVRGDHSGDITVTTGTVAGHGDYGINIAAANRADATNTAASYYSFAGIGHHGHSNGSGGGDLEGDITVVAERGGLVIKGGMNASTSTEVRLHAAQIGHGDYNSDGLKTGNIKVCIDGDILLENGDSRQSPVQIGHGGYSHTGDITGWIEVTSRNGSIVLDSSQGGIASIANTQIGHGGYATSGTFDGDISLSAMGDIRLSGGDATATHSQIGHGGVSSTGSFIGNLHLVAGGDFTLAGGGHQDGYAMVGHGSAGPSTSGARQGGMKLMVGGDTVLTDNASGVRLGHGTTSAGGISDAGFTLVTGTLDLSGHARGVSDIANEMGQDGEVTFAVLGGDLLVDGGGASFNHGFDVSFVASGDVILMTSVQNTGSGNVGAAGGWNSLAGYNPALYQFDGSNGLTFQLDFNNCLIMDVLEFDFGVVAGDDGLWGGNGGGAFIGDGTQTSGIAFGSALGSSTVLGHAVEVRGGDTTPGAYAIIGSAPVTGLSPTGAITIKAHAGGIAVIAGDQSSAYAQIGHRSFGALVSSISGDIEIESGGALSLRGGDAPQAAAQIGHGGLGSTLSGIDGAIDVSVATDLELIGGSGSAAAAYAQIGHGGLFTTADIGGDVAIATGGSIVLRSLAPDLSAYAKIGHGDDARGAVAALGGGGTRDGDIHVATDDNITMESALIGHVNSLSPATDLATKTWIGVSRDDPTDSAGGDLEADAGSEFSGTGEVRFYLPRRGNNQIAVGARINGVSYDGGALYEPWPVQRADEYTNYLTDANGVTTQPGQHDNSWGDGPAPTVPGGFAFYYNLIVLGGSFPPGPVEPGTTDGDGISGGGDGFEKPEEINFLSMFPDDRAFDDWLRDQEERFSRSGPFQIYYEGFQQYGYHGESTFEYEE